MLVLVVHELNPLWTADQRRNTEIEYLRIRINAWNCSVLQQQRVHIEAKTGAALASENKGGALSQVE